MGSDSIPQNSFGWTYKPGSSLCIHAFHCMDSKDPDVGVLDGWMPETKHTRHAPSLKTECDYPNGWTKNGHIRKNLKQKGEPQRSSWGTQKKIHATTACGWYFSWNLKVKKSFHRTIKCPLSVLFPERWLYLLVEAWITATCFCRCRLKCCKVSKKTLPGESLAQSVFVFHSMTWGRNSSLVVRWDHCPAWCSVVGSILPLQYFPVEGFFPMELTWVLTPFPLDMASDRVVFNPCLTILIHCSWFGYSHLFHWIPFRQPTLLG